MAVQCIIILAWSVGILKLKIYLEASRVLHIYNLEIYYHLSSSEIVAEILNLEKLIYYVININNSNE